MTRAAGGHGFLLRGPKQFGGDIEGDWRQEEAAPGPYAHQAGDGRAAKPVAIGRRIGSGSCERFGGGGGVTGDGRQLPGSRDNVARVASL